MADEIVVPINADFLILVFWKIPANPIQKPNRLAEIVIIVIKKENHWEAKRLRIIGDDGMKSPIVKTTNFIALTSKANIEMINDV